MGWRSSGWLGALGLLLWAWGAFAGGETASPPASGIVDPELEALIDQALNPDQFVARNAIDKLAKSGKAGEDALQARLFKAAKPGEQVKMAELLSRCGRGQVGYRVILELDPEGSGTVTLWSDRSVFADCDQRYEHLLGRTPPKYTDKALRHNPYDKLELLQYMSDRIKYEAGSVEMCGDHIVANGMLSFKSFEAFEAFAKGFDPTGYHMLGGCTLTDPQESLRTFIFQKACEPENSRSRQAKLLRFFDVKWEFVLDFKGHVSNTNACRTDGTKEIWQFNCLQMLNGGQLIKLDYDNTRLRPLAAVPSLPLAVQPHQLVALPKRTEILTQAYPKNTAKPLPGEMRELRERNQLVELDGRSSVPRDKPLQYQWRQISGNDLKLPLEGLAKDYVCLIIREPGEYQFELVVSLDNIHSKPATVQVSVGESAQPASQESSSDPPVPEKKSILPVTSEITKSSPLAESVQLPPVVRDPPPAKNMAPNSANEAGQNSRGPKTEIPGSQSANEEIHASMKPKPADQDGQDSRVQKTENTGSQRANECDSHAANVENIKPDPAKAAELKEQGLKLWKANNPLQAKTALAQAGVLNPEDKDCQSSLALVLMDLNELPQALKIFKEVAEATNSPEACMNAGHCCYRMGRLSEARNYYSLGEQLGGQAVAWERPWQSGNNMLRDKDYSSALDKLLEAEKKASQAKVVDFRLLRDLAIAFHGCKKDPEALARLNALQALGYASDAGLLAEVQKGAAGASPVEKKPEPVNVSQDPKPATLTNDTVKTSSKPPTFREKGADVVPLPDPPSASPSKVAPSQEGLGPAQKSGPSLMDDNSVMEPPPPKRKPVPLPKIPLPPVPNSFEEALAAGQRALQTGQRLQGENTAAAKESAERSLDEAEAMLRGAWLWRPDDENTLAAFKELSKYAGPIALAKNSVVRAKTKGLVVLDATGSIVPKDKPVYCVWEQVDGERLGLRPENMTKMRVEIRISKAGIYKFEFAISDGVRGGNPISVTVEVTE